LWLSETVEPRAKAIVRAGEEARIQVMKTAVEVVRPENVGRPESNGGAWKLIDVRDLEEFASVHVDGAMCVPLPRLLAEASKWSPEDRLMLICHSGQRARQAAATLQDAGFRHLAVVEGGTKACVQAGVPVTRGRKRIPLPRQVFMAAGVVLLIELTLATLVHPWLIGLCWATAAFMIVAGYTGFCPMSNLLAAMPWNRVGEAGADSRAAVGACSTSGRCA
jgi:rhodanese-related sulfurtransferase